MKEVADFIRFLTPSWTDKDRYNWLSFLHGWLVPIGLFLFLFINSTLLRFTILFIQVTTVLTEFFFKECLITMVEKEFSKEDWDGFARKLFRINNWELTELEKMAFNIGINIGILLVFITMLLHESMLWMIGIAGVMIPSLTWIMYYF
jgi:hypothetical protein